MPSPRLAVRAILLHQERLLLVNAWPDGQSDLWCAPGGGVARGSSLPDNLVRELYEETGLNISVGAPCLVNEFHDPERNYHQVEIFFRCTLTSGHLSDDWQDPDRVVTQRQFFARDQLQHIRLKPDSLRRLPWQDGLIYDPLERIVQ